MKVNRRKTAMQLFDLGMGWIVVGLTLWGITLAVGEMISWIG